MSDTYRICEFCIHFYSGRHCAEAGDDTVPVDQCRKYAPEVIPSHDNEQPPTTMFPEVSPSWWCSEWEPAPWTEDGERANALQT